MMVSLIILCALVLVGGAAYLHFRLSASQSDSSDPQGEAAVAVGENASSAEAADEACCGMHITCEKDSLLASVSNDVVYYDDEELDVYRGRNADEYSDDEIEQFRDVLLTLLPSDIAGWGRSLQLRGINLPDPVRDELLMIVAEARQINH